MLYKRKRSKIHDYRKESSGEWVRIAPHKSLGLQNNNDLMMITKERTSLKQKETQKLITSALLRETLLSKGGKHNYKAPRTPTPCKE